MQLGVCFLRTRVKDPDSGKVHENLEMTIDFYEKGKIKFTMYDYIANMLEDLPEDKKEVEAATPSGDHLFSTNKDKPEKLSEE